MKIRMAHIAAFILLLVPVRSYAIDHTLYWNASSNATSYEVHVSTDSGATYSQVGSDAPSSSCSASNVCSVVVSPTSGLHLYRVAAKNANGVTIRFDVGVWICDTCTGPAPITMPGVE